MCRTHAVFLVTIVDNLSHLGRTWVNTALNFLPFAVQLVKVQYIFDLPATVYGELHMCLDVAHLVHQPQVFILHTLQAIIVFLPSYLHIHDVMNSRNTQKIDGDVHVRRTFYQRSVTNAVFCLCCHMIFPYLLVHYNIKVSSHTLQLAKCT